MFCKYCGEKYDNAKFCSNCGASLAPAAPAVVQAEPAITHEAVAVQSATVQSETVQPAVVQATTVTPAIPQPMANGKALAVMIVSIVLGILPNAVSFVLSILALSKSASAKKAFSEGNTEAVELENAKGESFFKYSWICLIISASVSFIAFVTALAIYL